MSSLISGKVTIKPLIAIICGSGLGEIADLVDNREIVPYTDIPEFPRSTGFFHFLNHFFRLLLIYYKLLNLVLGHKGNFVFGHLSGLPVVCMQGRFHPFEGYCLALCTLPIKILKMMGVKLLVITNAAGGLNRSYNVGDLVLIKDHFSLSLISLINPLVGPNDERQGPRFVPVNNIYDKKMRDEIKMCASGMNIHLHEGRYGNIGGPSYETVTDSLFLLNCGIDCVGMSTTHEATVATYCGMKVLGISIITDKCCLEYDVVDNPDHNEIVQVAKSKAKQVEKLIACFLERIYKDQSLIE